MTYLLTFLQSNFLEVPFYCITHALLVRSHGPVLQRLGRSVLRTSFANLITHPIVFFGFLGSGGTTGLTWLQGILFAEAFAVIGETFIHAASYEEKFVSRQWVSLFGGAVVANLMSWELGPILTYFSFLR